MTSSQDGFPTRRAADAPTGRGTFTPAPGSAPLTRMVLAQGLLETRLLLRNGEQVLLALVIPLLLLVVGTLAPGIELGGSRRIDVLAPGVLALAVMSTAFTSVAIATGFERRYGVLKRLGASPLPRIGLLAGKLVAVGLVEALQVVVIVTAAVLPGWRPILHAGAVAATALLIGAGTAAFGALGLLMAGTLRAEATLAAANLVYLVLLVGGATLVPVDAYPAVIQPVIGWLPSGALAEGLRHVLAAAAPSTDVVAASVGTLVAWAVAGSLVTARVFRWE
jgi:ABC-2 type transport system permease protein